MNYPECVSLIPNRLMILTVNVSSSLLPPLLHRPHCEIDSSRVPPEWHGWLHSSTKEPPTESTVGSTHKEVPLTVALGSSAPYSRNLGGVISEFTQNLSMMRPRGYGLDNGAGSQSGTRSKVNEELYYTPPGYPLNSKNKSRFTSARRARMRFSLLDTPLTLQAKGAARAGLSLDDYQKFTDDDHPTKALLLLTGGHISREEGARIAASAAESGDAGALVEEALAGVPEDSVKRDFAARLALSLPVTEKDESSLASEAAKVLTPEESTVLKENLSFEALREQALVNQKYVEAYADIDMKEARRGVAAAIKLRDEALRKLKILQTGEKKLASFEAEVIAKRLA